MTGQEWALLAIALSGVGGFGAMLGGRVAARLASLEPTASGPGGRLTPPPLPPSGGAVFEPPAVALVGDMARLSDGSYAFGFRLEPSETLYAHHQTALELHRRLSAWLSAPDLPPGTVLQFRQAVRPASPFAAPSALAGPADGDAFGFWRTLAHRQAAMLWRPWIERGHTLFVSVGASGARRSTWGHVVGDLRDLAAAARRGRGLRQLGRLFSGSRILERFVAEERAACRAACEAAEMLTMTLPFRGRRMTADDFWRCLYFAFHEDAETAPCPPADEADLWGRLAGEPIVFLPEATLHGHTPVGLVSLSNPPQIEGQGRTGAYPGVMRPLFATAALDFRHTVVTEFITLDQVAQSARYDRQIEFYERFAVRALRGGLTHEGRQKLVELNNLRADIAAGRAAVVAARQRALVYGPRLTPAQRAAAERADSLAEVAPAVWETLDQRLKAVVAAYRQIEGVQAIIESPAARAAQYLGLLAGAADRRSVGREFEEVAVSGACLVGHERAWSPSSRPHTWLRSVSGEGVGLNVVDHEGRPPTIAIFGQSGSGKSVLAGALTLDALAAYPEARAQVVDFNSFSRLGAATGAQVFQFSMQCPRGFNVWYYDGLAEGVPVEEEQVELVLGDLKRLAGCDLNDRDVDRVFEGVAREVYATVAAANRARAASRAASGAAAEDTGWREPTLTLFLEYVENALRGDAFGPLRDVAFNLYLALKRHGGNPWLDARMDPIYLQDSRLIIYDMESLTPFTQDMRRALSYRVAARVTRALSTRGGRRLPRINVFDEFRRIAVDYPEMLYAIERGTRQGRKENVTTIFASQSYQDVAGMPGIAGNLGLKILGRQGGSQAALIGDFKLSSATVAAVESIQNAPGRYAQFLIVAGDGMSQQADFAALELTPVQNWLFTTHPDECNAYLEACRRLQSPAAAVAFLADRYPFGMAAMNRRSLLPEDYEALEAWEAAAGSLPAFAAAETRPVAVVQAC